MAKEIIEHIASIDSGEFWRRGTLGYLVRMRSIVVGGLTKLAFAGVSFWKAYYQLGVALLIFAATAALLLLYLRKRFIARSKADDHLHSFAHEMRDEMSGMMLEAKPVEHAIKVDRLTHSLVQQIAAYFRAIKNDESINCCLRIADNNDCFLTKARSDGLDKSRGGKSVSIPGDKGLAGALRRKDGHGVYIIRSIQKAIDVGMWMETPTDTLTDIKTLIVSPVNIIDNRERAMLGILYITSQHDGFLPPDTIMVKAFADSLGTMLAIASSIELKKQPSTKKARK